MMWNEDCLLLLMVGESAGLFLTGWTAVHISTDGITLARQGTCRGI
jgi:hypothetical protein